MEYGTVESIAVRYAVVRLLDIWKITRHKDRLVLLHEVGLDLCCVVARDLEAPKVLELVELLQAVTCKLDDHPVVLIHGEEGQTGVVHRLEAVSVAVCLKLNKPPATRHMSGSVYVTTCSSHVARSISQRNAEKIFCSGVVLFWSTLPAHFGGSKRTFCV